MKKINLLILEDVEADIDLVTKTLEKAGLEFDYTVANDRENFLEAIQHKTISAILADNALPCFNASEALQIIKDRDLHIPFILVTGSVSDDLAIEMLKRGACDYILKDRLQRLPVAILNAVHTQYLEREFQNKINAAVKNEALMKEAEKLAFFGSWEADVATGIHYWSDGQYRILGYEAGEIIPSFNNFISRVHPEDQYYLQNIIDQVLVNLEQQKYYCRVTPLKGRPAKHIEGEIFITKNDSGQPIRLNGITRDISERKNAEIQIITSEKKYQYLFESNPIPTWIIDKGTLRFLDVNQAAIKNYGYSYDEFLSMSSADIRPNDEKPRFLNNIIAEQYSGYEGVWRHKRKDGTVIIVDINTVNILFEGKKCKLVIANDVTEKIQSENKLRHATHRLNQAQEIAHIGNWELDFGTGTALWSDESCKIYGLYPGENVQSYESWLSFIHPDDIDAVLVKINESNTTLKGASFDHRIIRKDGVIRHIHSQFEFEINRHGKAIGLYGVSHDITEAKEAERALIQSEANLHLILDLLPQSVSARTIDGKFLFVNKRFAQMYGRTTESLVGETLKATIPVPNPQDEFMDRDREIILSGKTVIFPELSFTDANGSSKIFHVTKVPFIPAGKNEKAILGIGYDITEQKQAESERTKMVEDIIQRNKDLEQFSYIISHNLRAPVANLLGIAGLLNDGNLSDTEKNYLLTGISESVRKLDNVIIDLNDITKVRYSVHEAKDMVAFSDIVNNVIKSIGNLPENNITITTDFSEVDTFHTISNYMNSIFFNLITNSIKYKKTGSPLICEIKSKKLPHCIQLSFKDNGIGIDLNKVGNHIFEIYKRFHIGAAEGKGMGLFMVKTHVESMRGKITVASKLNKGTEFIIEFPLPDPY